MMLGSLVIISEFDKLDCSHITPQNDWSDKSNRPSVKARRGEKVDAGGTKPRGRVNKNRPQEVSPVQSTEGMLRAALDLRESVHL